VLEDIAPVFETLWDGWYLRGKIKFELGQYGLAENFVAKYIGRVPEDAEATRFAAIIALRRGAIGRAVGYLQPLAERMPDDVATLGLLADAYMAAGKPDLALEEFERALRLNPADPMVGTAAALARLGTGGAASARAELERVFNRGDGGAVAGPALVLAALHTGQVDEAVAVMEKLLGRNQRNPLYQTLAGMVAVKRGDFAAAERALRAAVALQPTAGSGVRHLANFYLATGRPDDAAKVYRDFLIQRPNDVPALLGIADIAAGRQQWGLATGYLRQARDAAPDDPRPGIRLVQLFLRRGEPRLAKLTADELANRFTADPDVLEMQARAQSAAGDSKAAAVTFKRAYQLRPETDATFARYLGFLLDTKNYQEAASLLQQAVDRNPTDLALKIRLVRVEAQANGLEAGIAKARDLAIDDPENPAFDTVSAELYENAGQHEEARALLETSAASRPANNDAALALASFYGRSGQPAKAEALLRSRLQAAPHDPVLRLALAQTYQLNQQLAEATAEYERVARDHPDEPAVLNNLAWLQQRRGDLAKARELAERAAALAPQDGTIIDTLGWILLAQGDAESALRQLAAANAAAPNNPVIQYHLAVALGRGGKPEEARVVLERLLGSGAAFPQRPEAEKLLAQLKQG
jgi:putative PEP-CTERM system TPR-repeat lipoprotein